MRLNFSVLWLLCALWLMPTLHASVALPVPTVQCVVEASTVDPPVVILATYQDLSVNYNEHSNAACQETARRQGHYGPGVAVVAVYLCDQSPGGLPPAPNFAQPVQTATYMGEGCVKRTRCLKTKFGTDRGLAAPIAASTRHTDTAFYQRE